MSAPLTVSRINVLLSLATIKVSGDAQITGITADSRKVSKGDLFVCMPSKNTDTHQLVSDAFDSGAVAVLVHSEVAFEEFRRHKNCVIYVPFSWGNEQDFYKILSLLSKEILGDPSSAMSLIGITGTNGKTTVAWLFSQALNLSGRKTAYLGTLGLKIADGILEEIGNTTPFPVDFWNILATARDQGVQDFVFEASSHALEQNRFAGARIIAGAFTNLTQDHLDYHGNMWSYEQAKKLLFTNYTTGNAEEPFVAVINEDDPTGKTWLDTELFADSERFFCIGYGENGRDMKILESQISATGIKFSAEIAGETIDIMSPLAGNFNALNIQTVVALMYGLGSPKQEIEVIIPLLKPVAGRFESISNRHGFTVIVDYAHTPDALESLLTSARDITENRLICVFGCGGDRDSVKRPIMAKISTNIANHTVLTADNPRTESLEKIMADLKSGVIPGSSYSIEEDRPTAIKQAIATANPGDVVVVAGKGHESNQIIGREKFPMDDRLICSEAIENYIPSEAQK